MAKPSYVYMIGAMGTPLVKIGKSDDPYSRLQELNTTSFPGMPFIYCTIRCINSKRAEHFEKQLHKLLIHKRLTLKREWFLIPTEQMKQMLLNLLFSKIISSEYPKEKELINNSLSFLEYFFYSEENKTLDEDTSYYYDEITTSLRDNTIFNLLYSYDLVELSDFDDII